MEEKIEDLLRHYDLKEWQIEDLKKELLNLHSVSKSSYCDDCGDWAGGCDNEDCKYKKVDVC
jgi:hypothetical protein